MTKIIVRPPKKVIVTATPPVVRHVRVTAAATGKPGVKGDKGDKGDAGDVNPNATIDGGIIF